MLLRILLLGLLVQCASAQQYNDEQSFFIDQNESEINWCGIPERFNLNPRLKLIYGIDPVYDNLRYKGSCEVDSLLSYIPLKYGYTHINVPLDTNNVIYKGLAPNERASIVYLNRYLNTREYPIIKDKSPFNNDFEKFNSDLKEKVLKHGAGLELDYLVWDIEKAVFGDARISKHLLEKKAESESIWEAIPAALDVQEYKTLLHDFYLRFLESGDSYLCYDGLQQSSYADVPIRRSYHQVRKTDWDDLIADKADISNYLFFDENENPTDFYKSLDLLTPSTYLIYQSGERGDNYLAYALFQIEANLKFRDSYYELTGQKKEVIPFVWMRYHPNTPIKSNSRKLIEPYKADSLAIFTLMSGADGLWLWDALDYYDRKFKELRGESFVTYNYFNRGLYRISKFNEFFDTSSQILNQSNSNVKDPNRLFKQQTPVWRGIVSKDRSKILVAAHNPYAQEGQQTRMRIEYNSSDGTQSFTKEIILQGKETFLEAFPIKN